MSNTSEGLSKMWIYFPLWLIVTACSVWALYGFMQPKAAVVLPPPPVIEPEPTETVPTDFKDCFLEQKNVLGGMFELIPVRKLVTVFENYDANCFEKMCTELQNIAAGKERAAHFYSRADGGDRCFAPVLRSTLAYHHLQLEELTLLPLFYNSGQNKLTRLQESRLDAFLSFLKKNAEDYGILIIGRASKVGNADANKQLSRRRAESIIEFIENHRVSGLQTEFVYFGDAPPQLNLDLAARYDIQQKDYRNISYGGGGDSDFSLRLNQSVMLVIYSKADDPFGLGENLW